MAVHLTSSGLSMPASQSASGDANTLDDYEEGTWTPHVVGTTTTGGYSGVARGGTYIKTGMNVHIWGFFYGNSGTGGGNLLLSNLPIPQQTSAHTGHGSAQWNGGVSYPSTGATDAQFVTNMSDGFYVRCNGNNVDFEYLPYPSNMNYLRFSISYYV
jgi:hypothetical protein